MEKNDTVAASKATTKHISAAAVSETIAEVNNTSTAIVDKDVFSSTGSFETQILDLSSSNCETILYSFIYNYI